MLQNKKEQQIKSAISIKEFCERFGIGLTTVKRLLRDRRLGHVKVGRKVLITDQQIEEFFVSNAVAAINAEATAKQIRRKRAI